MWIHIKNNQGVMETRENSERQKSKLRAIDTTWPCGRPCVTHNRVTSHTLDRVSMARPIRLCGPHGHVGLNSENFP